MTEDFEMMEKIDAWLSGKMDTAERIKFEEEISNSPELAAEVESQQMADLVILGDRLNQIKQQMDQDFRDGKVGKTTEKQFPFKGITGMLLILLTSGTTAYYLLKQLKDKPAAIERQSEIPQISSGKISNNKETDIVPASSGQLTEKQSHSSELNVADKNENINELPVLRDSDSSLVPLADKNSADVVIACRTVTMEEPQYAHSSDSIVKKAEIISKKTEDIKEEKTEEPQPAEKESDSFSFSPGYQEVFKIPMNKGTEAEFTVLDRSGKVVWRERVYQDRDNTWDGSNLQGGISRPDLYIYCLDYTNGIKVRGQIIIY